MCVRVCVLCIFTCIFPYRAAAVLAQVEPSLAELLGGRDLVLPFSGISHFRKEVVFVGLACGQHRHTLDSLAGQWQTFSFLLLWSSFLSLSLWCLGLKALSDIFVLLAFHALVEGEIQC